MKESKCLLLAMSLLIVSVVIGSFQTHAESAVIHVFVAQNRAPCVNFRASFLSSLFTTNYEDEKYDLINTFGSIMSKTFLI